VVDGTIKEYSITPYDWRLWLEHIIGGGVIQDRKISYLEQTSDPYILSNLKQLASESDSGKVIIVGHSMGGMVGKQLIMNLENPAYPFHHLYYSIEAFVMVGTPQLGTPKTLLPMLHGGANYLDTI